MTSGSPLTQTDIWSKAVWNNIFYEKNSQETVSNTGTAVIRVRRTGFRITKHMLYRTTSK